MTAPRRFDLGEDRHLRPLDAADADELLALQLANREHLEPWMPWAARPITPASTREFLRLAAEQQAAANGFQAAVVVEGRLAGTVGFHRIDRVHRSTSIGYWLAADQQGRGTMTAAVRALVGHAFAAWGLHRVAIEAAPDNVRSRAIPERLGFTEEGLLREVELVGGRWLDHVVYGMLEREWR